MYICELIKRNLIISTLMCELNFIASKFVFHIFRKSLACKYRKSHPATVNVCEELKRHLHFKNMETTIKNHVRFLSRYDKEYALKRMISLLLNRILQLTCMPVNGGYIN